MSKLIHLILIVSELKLLMSHILPKSYEHLLLEDLLEGYEKSVRPVLNSSHAVTVLIGLTLTMVHDVDERNQVLTSNVWLDQQWYDERLKWDPAEYDGLSNLRLPCEKLWLPDIVLYNSVDDHSAGYHKALAWVYSDGKVFWPPIVRMRSSCKLDISYFPFDDQLCTLKLGSWSYDGFQLDVAKLRKNIDMENMIDNGEWSLIQTAVVRNVVVYPCCSEPYPDITFYLHMRRRNLYYTFNVIIPCIILSSLTLVGFVLPPDSGEKVTLGLTVLLAYSVFMLLIAENMPPTSEFAPLVGIYLTVVMALTSLSVAFAVLVLNLHHRGKTDSRPPRWLLKIITRYIIRLLLIDPPTFLLDYDIISGHNDSEVLTLSNQGNQEMSTSQTQDDQRYSKLYSPSLFHGHQIYNPRLRFKITEPCNYRGSNGGSIGGNRCVSNGADNSPIYLSRNNHHNVYQCTESADTNLNEKSNYATIIQPSRVNRNSVCIPVEETDNNETQNVDESDVDSQSSDSPMFMAQNFRKNRRAADSSGHVEIVDHLRQLIQRQEAMEDEALRIKEWHFVAMVMDQVMCVIFVLTTVLSTLWLLVFKPMMKNLQVHLPPNNVTFTGNMSPSNMTL